MAILLVGCLSVPSPKQQKYLLHVPLPNMQQKTKRARVITVLSPDVAQQFGDRYFVYRVSNIQYRSDFYHLFLLPPSEQFQEIFINYLNRLQTVRQAIDASGPIQTNWKLHSRIVELYADYRDRSRPAAVMTIQFALFNDVHGQARQIFLKTYTVRTVLCTKSSEALVHGWSQDLSKILKQLSRKI